MTFISAVLLATPGCVQQYVVETVTEHASREGIRHAREVKEQSPFATVELRWSEAHKLMERRNRTFLAARTEYLEANKEQPVIREITSELTGAVTVSMGDAFKPEALLASLRSPVTQLPKQLASLGQIKNISHKLEANAWDSTARAVDAEVKMRTERVKLQRMLRLGELIDGELSRVRGAAPAADSDPKLVAAIDEWRGQLSNERQKWLGDVRNFFDAEYQDVRFLKDGSSFPSYNEVVQPDLAEWTRWCQLNRSKELVTILRKNHASSTPAIPGTELVKETLAGLVSPDGSTPVPILDTALIRGEVRSLIQNWRGMKEAQAAAKNLEDHDTSPATDHLEGIHRRQQIYKLRQQEIQHASAVWMVDEDCWIAGAMCRR